MSPSSRKREGQERSSAATNVDSGDNNDITMVVKPLPLSPSSSSSPPVPPPSWTHCCWKHGLLCFYRWCGGGGQSKRKLSLLIVVATIAVTTTIIQVVPNSNPSLRAEQGVVAKLQQQSRQAIDDNSTTTTTTATTGTVSSRHTWKPVMDFQWCRRPQQPGEDNDDYKHGDNLETPGLVYIKVDKTASSTLAGINIRIARHVGSRVLLSPSFSSSSRSWLSGIVQYVWQAHWQQQQQQQQQTQSQDDPVVCSHTYHHGRAAKVLANHAYRKKGELRQKRDSPSSSPPFLLWTFVRDPFQRTLSEFRHFYMSRLGQPATQKAFRSLLDERNNYELEYILDVDNPQQEIWKVLGDTTIDGPGKSAEQRRKGILKLIEDHILESYDFVGLLERMEESLAVMKLLWNLPLGDFVVLSAKKSGGYDDGRFNETCFQIAPHFQGDLSGLSHKSGSRNYDYLLYEVINATLDRTIAMLGPALVDKTRQTLRHLQQKAEEECQEQAIFPCSSNGTPQYRKSRKNCYWFDSGCGFSCVDKVAEQESLS